MWGLAGEGPASPARVSRYAIRPPDGYRIGPSEGLAFSADGDRLVYSAFGLGARQQLFLRTRGQIEPSIIAGSEDGTQPFFSPDGEWVAFVGPGGRLQTIALAGGGAARTLAVGNIFAGGAWGPDDTIVYSFGRELFRVDARGGKPLALTTVEAFDSHSWPAFLPDGSSILYTISTGPTMEDKQIALLSLETGAHRILVDGTSPSVSPTGHLVFARSGSLWAAPFDSATGRVTGPAAPVLDDLQVNLPGGWAHYSFASDGTLTYLPQTGMAGPSRLVWVPREGAPEPVLGLPLGVFLGVAYAPRGDRVAVGLAGGSGGLNNYELWTYDIARETPTPLTTNATAPLWSQDGERLVYFSLEVGQEGIYRRRWGGTDEPELLYRPPGASGTSGVVAFPGAWSGNGESLVFVEGNPTGDFDINLLSMDDDRRVTPLIATEFREQSAGVSPDGRWITYVSNRSGIEEVYIQSFPGLEQRVQVSNGGARHPVWGPNGDELFYLFLRLRASSGVGRHERRHHCRGREAFRFRGLRELRSRVRPRQSARVRHQSGRHAPGERSARVGRPRRAERPGGRGELVRGTERAGTRPVIRDPSASGVYTGRSLTTPSEFAILVVHYYLDGAEPHARAPL